MFENITETWNRLLQFNFSEQLRLQGGSHHRYRLRPWTSRDHLNGCRRLGQGRAARMRSCAAVVQILAQPANDRCYLGCFETQRTLPETAQHLRERWYVFLRIARN